MGCIVKRRSNYYNFIGAQRANGVVIGDLTGDVPFCTDFLAAPTLFGAADNYFEATLSWINVPSASEYKIYRSLDDSSYTLIDTVPNSPYTDSTLNIDTLYYYKIKSSNGVVDSPFSNTISLTTEDTIPAPSGLTLSDIQLESIQLDWTSNSFGGEDEFQIYRSLDDISYSQIGIVGTGITTYVDDTPPLDHDTTYYYKVRAERGGDFSDYSNTENATTLLMAAPSNLSASSTIYNKIDLTWTSNSFSEEDGFEIQRSLDDVSYSAIGTVGTNVTAFTDEGSGLKGSTLYYYRVRATEDQGNSAWSGTDSITTGTSLLNLANPNGDQLTNPNSDKLVAIA